MRNLACLALLAMSCAMCFAADAFTRMNDSLKTDAAITYYSNCFLDKGHCSGDARAVKWLLPDLIATSCNKCSTKQKRVGCRIISMLQQKKHADTWNALLKKYDPKKTHIKKLEGFNKMCETKFNVTVVNKEADETKKATAAPTVVVVEVNKQAEKVDEKKG